jgi:hypothetical protein
VGGDFTYVETRYGAVILSYNGNETRVRIPAELGGKPVKAIDHYLSYTAFYQKPWRPFCCPAR